MMIIQTKHPLKIDFCLPSSDLRDFSEILSFDGPVISGLNLIIISLFTFVLLPTVIFSSISSSNRFSYDVLKESNLYNISKFENIQRE